VFARVGTSCGVRVGRFKVNAVSFDDIFESLVHETSVATLVSFGSGAIDQILFGKANEALLGQKPSTFDGSGGREGPARTALSLILDSGNGAVLSPIPGVGSFGIDVYGMGAFRAGASYVEAIVDTGKFLAGKIAELVHFNGEAASVGVPIVDKVKI